MKKKFIYLLIIIFVFTISIIAIHSCKKDQSLSDNTSTIKYSPEAMSIYYKLLSFKNKIENNTKTGELISPDSAVWYLEATLNVSNGYPDSSYHWLTTDTSYYSIPIDPQGNVLMDDVIEVYNQMLDTLQYQLNQIQSSIKFLIAGDVQIQNQNNNLELLLINSYGSDEMPIPLMFHEDDDWYYGNMLGKCDGTQQWESDAGEEIEWRVNAQVGIGKLVYVLTKDHWYWDYPTNNNPYGDYRIYYEYVPYNITWRIPPCIHDDTLNYYYPEAIVITHTIESQGGGCPDTLEFITVDVKSKDSLEIINLDTNHHYSHYYVTKYGKYYDIPEL